MTVKEICDISGKRKTAVYEWIKIASGNGKIFSGNGNYVLNEVIEILRAGKISESLISLLIENAEKSHQPVDRIERLESMIDRLISSIPTLIIETVKALQPQSGQKLIEKPKDKFDYQAQWIAEKNRQAATRKLKARQDELDLFSD